MSQAVLDQLESTASDRGNAYAASSRSLRRSLNAVVSKETVRELHERDPWRHGRIVFLQVSVLALATVGLWRIESPWLWIPLAIVQGWSIFNFTVLLHEVVHDAVFRDRRTRWNRWLGQLYAFPSGISASQFTRWHLDHHAELGHEVDDPKRHHLSPRVHARWYKLLYFTPFLFLLYFRGAKRETGRYGDGLRERIRIERVLTILFQLAIATALGMFGGAGVLTRVYLVPVLFVFPVAFALNRIGQHYDIDPSDPAKWSTLMKPSRFWDRAFLYSNYHLEHHYFPRVPFYNLPALHRALDPFYASIGLRKRTYSELLWNWFVLNREPHTSWDDASDKSAAEATS